MVTEPSPGAKVAAVCAVMLALALPCKVTMAPLIEATVLPRSGDPTPNPGGSDAVARVTWLLAVELAMTAILGS
jgi:hypothetical protein